MRKPLAATSLGTVLLLFGGCKEEPARAQRTDSPAAQTVSGSRPTDNQPCLVCHELLADELISREHELESILCVDCHGLSRSHSEDKMLMIKPDLLFGRSEVEPFCRSCHPAHKDMAKVDAFLSEWHGRERPNGRVVTSASICTDCHGTHNLHRSDSGRKTATAPAESTRPGASLFNLRDCTDGRLVGNDRRAVKNGSIKA